MSEPNPPIHLQIRLLLADDHPAMREGLALILNQEPDLQVVAQASDGAEAARLFREVRPDIALLDVRMPGTSGVEAIKRIRQEFPSARLILLTTYHTDEEIAGGLKAGARAYLLKDDPLSEILETIRAVHRGDRRITPRVAAQFSDCLTLPPLSEREREVVQLLARGRSNAEIGVELFISQTTVKSHVNRILQKLEVSDRTQAVIVALKRGLATLD